jgi:uncharacterized protein with GYD domain
MPKYLVSVSYSAEGARGVLKEGGSARKAFIEQLITDAGGSVEAFYFAFGEHDVHVVCDAPSNVDVAALTMAVAASGAGGIKTTVLLTAEEVDEATKKSVGYRPPGG